jgi:hypothetical protein
MHTAVQPRQESRKIIWISYLMSATPVLIMLMAGTMKLFKPAGVVQGFAHFGYAESVILWIAMAEIGSALLYLIPRTSVLGAILITGFLGGAVATHVRLGEAVFVMPLMLGILAWGGLFLRDQRLRALLPLRA